MKNHHPPNRRGALSLRWFAPTIVKLRPWLALITLGSTPLAKANWVAGRDLIANEASATTEQTNPNPTVPAWSYGYRIPLTSTALAATPITNFVSADHSNNYGGLAGLDGFASGFGGIFPPLVLANTSSVPIVRAGVLNLNPGELELHPGVNGEHAIVRWTAPITGTFSIAANWEDINPSTGNAADGATGSIVVNGVVHYTQSWINGGPGVNVVIPSITLTSGDKVDFAVGMNSNWASDSTRFNATITDLALSSTIPSLLPVDCDEAVVTCYSGVTGNPATGPVDPNGFVVAVIDTRNPAANGAVLGGNWMPPMYHNENGGSANIWNARNLGQVFGVTLDRAAKPNIYVAATSIYGFAPQGWAFSQNYGPGGPGAVYKLDGVTGAISTFASLPNTVGAGNKAPSLGNICFDRMRNQFFVSNFEDGLIYRLDLSGSWSSAQTYDHGSNGRPNVAPRLPIADDGVIGVMTQLERRVWGLNVFDNRLYYAVWSEDLAHGSSAVSNEIWSVGFDPMGLPDAATANLEISLPVNPLPYWRPGYTIPINFSSPVSDITFDDLGHMLLAERSMPYDAHTSRVLEYQLNTTTGSWVQDPKNLYIGAAIAPATAAAVNSSAGGVDLACDGKIWATGDAMRLLPSTPEQYAYGLTQMPRAGNTLATIASPNYFIDYNPPNFSVNDKTQIGDVVINRQCCECAQINDIKVTCVPRPAPALGPNYTWTFQLVNTTPSPIGHVSFMDTPGFTVSGGQIYNLPTPLAPGSATNITVTLIPTSVPIPSHVCLHMGIHSAIFETCCEIVHCVELSECCAEITNMCLTPDPKGNGDWTLCFDYTNLSPNEVSWVFMVPAAGYLDCVTSLVLTAIPPLAPGQKQTFCKTVTIKPECRKLCLIFSGHTANFAKCCSITKCIEVPCICKDKTWTLNADFDAGTLINVNHDTANQLQLNAVAKPMPYVCIPCSLRGTVARIDINGPNSSAAVMGEYLSAPESFGGSTVGRNPSRTTVDKYGNVWIGNRNSNQKLDGTPSTGAADSYGSVTRIGLVLGGTRGDLVGTVFTPNPLGSYLKPPFTYNTCNDRDNDGYIKTSRGLGHILPWSNAGNADTAGGVSTAEDEAITIYTRVPGSGTRFLAIDCNNNLWTGGNGDQDFQAVDGFTGALIPGTFFNHGAGGYGGLIDGFGNIWGGQTLMRTNTGTLASLPVQNSPNTRVYGLGIDPRNCQVVSSTLSAYNPETMSYQSGMSTFDTNGNLLNHFPSLTGAMGVCVTGTGHVFAAAGNKAYHLTPSGATYAPATNNITIPTSPHGSGVYIRGVAVDTNGHVWAADYSGNSAHRINTTTMTVDKTIDLGNAASHPSGIAAQPYNYSDMTGFVAIGATCREGSWTAVHDGGCAGAEWGEVTWNAQLGNSGGIVVDLRADDQITLLPSHSFVSVKNGGSTCGRGIIGRYVEVRVRFIGIPCTTNSPVLTDLKLECCKDHDSCVHEDHAPIATSCPDEEINVYPAAGVSSVTVSLPAILSDADGDPISYQWKEALTVIASGTIPASGPPTVGHADLHQSLSLGTHFLSLCVLVDGQYRLVCENTVNVGDNSPPVLTDSHGGVAIAWNGTVPDFAAGLEVTDASPVRITQNPPPGTVKGVGIHKVFITATDSSENSTPMETSFTVNPKLALTAPADYAIIPQGQPVRAAASLASGVTPPRSISFIVNGLVVSTSTRPGLSAEFTMNGLAPGSYAIIASATSEDDQVAQVDKPQTFIIEAVSGAAPAPLPSPSLTIQEKNICLCVQAAVGQNCVIETSTDLLTWAALPNGSFVGDGTLQELIFPKADPPEAKRYYRIRYVNSTP